MAIQVFMPAVSLPRLEKDLPTGVQLLLMESDGSLSMDGKPVSPEEASPEVAWANTDIYVNGPIKQFIVQCLKSPGLRWFHTSSAGFDHPVFGMLIDKGVTLTNSDASCVAIAEFVFARLFDHYHPAAERRAAQAQGRWQRLPFREIADTRWVVVGLGPVGRAIATRARAFGAHVTGVRRTPQGDAPVDREVAASQLLDQLAGAHVVVLAAPANADSKGLVNADFLGRLGTDTVLINIGRGSLIDEAALLESLERGVPEAAILDVFATEPLPDDSPLWKHPRVLVSAHCAPASDGFVRRGDAIFVENIRRYVNGEALHNVVEPWRVKG